jgi:hypothetical protein
LDANSRLARDTASINPATNVSQAGAPRQPARRKLERMLAMLLRLKDLRRPAEPD